MASPKFIAVSWAALAFRLALMLAVSPLSALSQPTLDVDLGSIVTDPSGKPVAGARLSLMRATFVTFSDENGRYRLQGSATAIRRPHKILPDPQGSSAGFRFFRFAGPGGSVAWDAAGRNLEVSPSASAPRESASLPTLAKSAADPDTLDVFQA